MSCQLNLATDNNCILIQAVKIHPGWKKNRQDPTSVCVFVSVFVTVFVCVCVCVCVCLCLCVWEYI